MGEGEFIWERPEGKLNPGASVLGKEEIEEVLAVIKGRALSRDYGPDSRETVLNFERNIVEKLGAGFALGVTSGTAALKVALASAGVGPGHEVIMPCCTFISSASSTISLGAVPVFAEIDDSLSIDPDDIEARITPHTKAILPVHLYGVPCQIDRVVEIAKKHNLKVIENCALSCGTKFKNRYIGTWGDLGIYSMQIVKVITAGEGGVVVSSDPALYERAVRYHDIGGYREKTRLTGVTGNEDEFLGENFRISELTGAVALRQLEKLDRITGSLRDIYMRYRKGIEAIPGLKLQPVNDPEGALATRWGLLFEDVETCTRFAGLLKDKGLSPGLMYGGNPIYMQPKILNQVMHTPEANPWTSPAYKGKTRTYQAGQCPRSEDIMNRVLIVASVNPLYTEHDVDGILSIIREAAGSL